MNTHNKFKKTLLTKRVSLLLSSAIIMPAIAQKSPANDVTEVIAVTGIRGSLLKSMDLKRDSEGLGCRKFYFKYCSIFNSTFKGNIGPAIVALLDALKLQSTIICPALPVNCRTV